MSADGDTSEGLTARVLRFRGRIRFVALVAVVAVGILDTVTGPHTASAVFYVPILLVLAFADTWGVCVIYALAAAAVRLAANLAQDPSRAVFVHPYWAAFAEWTVLALVAGAVSLLFHERRRVRQAERAVQDKTLELHDGQRRLDEALREVERLRDDLQRRERQARIGDAVFATAHDMERPLASAAVYVEEVTRLVGHAQALTNPHVVLDELPPLLEKLEERVHGMDRILRTIRDLHNFGPMA